MSPVGFLRKRDNEPTVKLDAKLWLTADRASVVEDGHPDSAFLLGLPGDEIPASEAARLGIKGEVKAVANAPALPEPEPAPAPEPGKESAPGGDKQSAPSGDKSRTPRAKPSRARASKTITKAKPARARSESKPVPKPEGDA